MHKSWVDGPKELLYHAAEHFSKASDFDNRIAFISIDNAVELAIVTFLSLPRRILKRAGPTRKELVDVGNSFPAYLDLLEKYASDLLSEIDLEDIEWYHRIRNQLYHNGNCITVEKAKVEAYYEIGKVLFTTLFEEDFTSPANIRYETELGIFIARWKHFDEVFRAKLPPKNDFAYHWKRDYLASIDECLVPIYNEVSQFRNDVVHLNDSVEPEKFKEMVEKIAFIERRIK